MKQMIINLFGRPGLICLSLLLCHFSVQAADIGQSLKLRGLFDFQYLHSHAAKSYLKRGPGVFRYDQPNQAAFNLAGLELQWRPQLAHRFKLSANYSPAQDDEFGDQRLQITEAYWLYRPLPKSNWRAQYRIGAFYPTMSVENRGLLWTSPYSTKFSGINSWMADELRTIGIETRWSWKNSLGATNTLKGLSLIAALHWFNDPTGAMISWRGFNLHDRQTGLGGTTPMWQTPGVGNTRNPQARHYEPFLEIDNRPGFYLGLEEKLRLADGDIKLSVYYYDNAADETQFKQGQYAWRTRFYHLAMDWSVSSTIRILGQYLDGDTKMDKHFVDNDFKAAYIMAIKDVGQHRFAIRAERFRVSDLDNTLLDDNHDKSSALTLSYHYSFLKHWKLNLESNIYRSDRLRRVHFGQISQRQERQYSASLRYYLD